MYTYNTYILPAPVINNHSNDIDNIYTYYDINNVNNNNNNNNTNANANILMNINNIDDGILYNILMAMNSMNNNNSNTQ